MSLADHFHAELQRHDQAQFCQVDPATITVIVEGWLREAWEAGAAAAFDPDAPEFFEEWVRERLGTDWVRPEPKTPQE